MNWPAGSLKNLFRSCLAILPIVLAGAPGAALASIEPEHRETHLQPSSAALPFFAASARFGTVALDLPMWGFQTPFPAAPGSSLAVHALSAVSLPAAATPDGTVPSGAEYWQRLGDAVRAPLATQARSLPPARGEVLGSVPLAISEAPLSRRWRAALAEQATSYFANSCDAERAVCASKLRQQLLGVVAIAQRQDEQEAIRSINSAVNSRLGYRSDLDSYGVPDYWATMAEVLQRGTGDCKGYAILKMWLLLAAGFDRSQLRLQLVKIPATGQDHAILVVNTSAGQLILDNIKSDVRNDADVKEYVPLLSFIENSTQIHGIKRASRTHS